MTAIVGITDQTKVYIGGDSGSSDGWLETIRSDEKVFRNGPYLFGFTTSFRMGQLLHHALTPPEPTGELDRFMVTTFVDAVRDCLKSGGWAQKTNEREEGGDFLVGIGGRLFTVFGDYQVAEQVAGHAAIGSGYLAALGSLHTTAQYDIAPRQRIVHALQAAEHHTSGVREPFTILKA
jgi:ATP-dependent protease HslVU (ClpYQ) peptidase subunit